jgi:HSP20 family protein
MRNKLAPFPSGSTLDFPMSRGSNLFDDLLNLLDNNRQSSWIPAFDIADEKDNLVIRADVPGIKEDDLNIEVNNNILTISGERSSENKGEHNGYYRVERSQGRFSRSIQLPEDVDPQDISADYKDGVLEIKAAKSEDHTRSFKIAVNNKTSRSEINTSGSEKKKD